MSSFILSGEPQGKSRPRFAGGHTYTPAKTREYEDALKWAYKANKGMMHDGSVSVSIHAYYSIPKSDTKARKRSKAMQYIRPQKKPDIDNVAKIVLDGLNGVAYADDTQVVELSVNKWYSDNPLIKVTVEDI